MIETEATSIVVEVVEEDQDRQSLSRFFVDLSYTKPLLLFLFSYLYDLVFCSTVLKIEKKIHSLFFYSDRC